MTENEVKDTSPTIGKLATALVKAQAEMPAAKFDATNPFLKNKYATLGCVIETARPILAKHGLAIMQPVVSSRNGDIGIRTMVIHESGEFISSEAYMPVIEQKGVSLAQVAGSVISYLRRYSISSMLGIYADEDTDANEGEVVKKKSGKKELDEAFPKKEAKKKSDGRPYPAAVAREKIEQFAEHKDFQGRKRTEKRGEKLSLETAIVLNLNKCFEGNPDPDKDRHSVLAYISRGESASIKGDFWIGARLCAIEKWLEVQEWEGQGAGYSPRKESRLEAVDMVVTRMKEQGQQELDV